MKQSFLRLLVCPPCKAELALSARESQNDEILTGSLRCAQCDRVYEISGGVPRFVDRGAYASSFGFQWRRFATVQLDSKNGTSQSRDTFRQTTGWNAEDLKGKLVLDAGVGAGRFAEIVADDGGEVVGIDLTAAIDAAYENVGSRPNVHLCQADLFSLPFRDETFDLGYSIGVIHHTPDPREAFASIARAIKVAGQFAVYVYPDYFVGRRSSDLIRRLTTKLPSEWAFRWASLAIPLYHLYRLPVLNRVLPSLFPISMHPNRKWRWLDTFDWYTPTYQWKLSYPEVFRLFRENGFTDVELFDEPIRMRGTKARALERGQLLASAGGSP